MNITFDQLGDVLDDAIRCLEERKDDYEIRPLKFVEAEMKGRIHNVRGGENSVGKPFKRYSSLYLQERQNAGVNNGPNPNLIFTNQLNKSYETGKIGGKNVIYFNNNIRVGSIYSNSQIAAFNEDRYGETFRPNKRELEGAKKLLIQDFERVARQCFG